MGVDIIRSEHEQPLLNALAADITLERGDQVSVLALFGDQIRRHHQLKGAAIDCAWTARRMALRCCIDAGSMPR